MAVQKQPVQLDLASKDITLSDGRVVTIREATGLEDMLVEGIVGQDPTLNDKQRVKLALLIGRVSALCSIKVIDGQEQIMPTTIGEAMRLASQFKKRDLDKIIMEYTKFIGDESGELQKGETSSQQQEPGQK